MNICSELMYPIPGINCKRFRKFFSECGNAGSMPGPLCSGAGSRPVRRAAAGVAQTVAPVVPGWRWQASRAGLLLAPGRFCVPWWRGLRRCPPAMHRARHREPLPRRLWCAAWLRVYTAFKLIARPPTYM